MPASTFLDATFADLSATAVPPKCLPQMMPHGFTTKRIDPMTGRALECLAHAIAHIGGSTSVHQHPGKEAIAADQAISLLKGLNRQIFAELPNLPERRNLLRQIVQKWESTSD